MQRPPPQLPGVNVRPYTDRDFEMLCSWWKASGTVGIKPSMLPPTTYVLEYKGRPVFAHSLVCTNVKEYAYLENFVSDPSYKSPNRHELSLTMVQFMERLAKNLGYKRLLSLAPNSKLQSRYQDIGWTTTLTGVSTVMKEL